MLQFSLIVIVVIVKVVILEFHPAETKLDRPGCFHGFPVSKKKKKKKKKKCTVGKIKHSSCSPPNSRISSPNTIRTYRLETIWF